MGKEKWSLAMPLTIVTIMLIYFLNYLESTIRQSTDYLIAGQNVSFINLEKIKIKIEISEVEK